MKTYTQETLNYIGIGEDEFKARYNNHKKLFTPY